MITLDTRIVQSTNLVCILLITLYGCVEASAPVQEGEVNQGTLDLGSEGEAGGEFDQSIPNDLSPIEESDSGRPIIEPPLTPHLVVVKLGQEQTAAGVSNQVSCLVYAQNGQTVPLDPSWGEPRFDIRPLTGWSWREGGANQAVGEHAGIYEARCNLPSFGLRSEAQFWRVNPGPITNMKVQLEDAEGGDVLIATAGDTIQAECSAFDAYENRVELTEVEWTYEPPLEAESNGDQISLRPTLATTYHLGCLTPQSMGATSIPAELIIQPDLPASLDVRFATGRSVYPLGDLIELQAEVRDRFDNPVEGTPLRYRTSPYSPSFGVARFLPRTPNEYTATVTVEGETYDGEPLVVTKDFIVEDGAPRITCSSPFLGENTTLGRLTLTGRAVDLSDLASITVNGDAVSFDQEGNFSAQVTPTWGLNIAEVIATDQFGNESVQRCMFFASGVYLPELQAIDDVALLYLGQAAIDDGAPRSPISSLGDLLGGMLNSQSLINTVHRALLAQNPIYPSNCIWNLFGCRFSVQARYNSLSVQGPNTIDLDLINGGIGIDTTLRGLTLNLTASGIVLGANWSQGGSVNLSSARIQAQMNVGLSGGQPQITLRGDPTVTIGNITLNLSLNLGGVGSFINTALNFILDAFEGLIRDQLASTLEEFITSEVDAILSTALSSLDLSAIGLNVNLPRPLGGQDYALRVSLSFNRLEANSTRMLIGMKSLLTGSRSQTTVSRGIASPTGSRNVSIAPGVGRDSSGAAHVTLINSILHRLWRGKYFDISALPEAIGGGVDLEMELLVPPAIELASTGNGLTLHFGPAIAEINAPDLFDDPITLHVGGFASSSISINQSAQLTFAPITVDEVYFSSPGFNLSVSTSQALETVVIEVMQSVLDEALNSAIPNFPIPDFVLPSSLTAYGIPAGTRLGVRNLVLSQDGRRLIVKGDLR